MLVYKILKEQESNFVLFKNLCQTPGFVSEILSVMGDLKRVLIDAPRLQKASLEMTDPILAQKAGELAILFKEYDLALNETNLKDPQENYTQTTRHISILSQMKSSFEIDKSEMKKDETNGGTFAKTLVWPYDKLEWLFGLKIWIVGFGESRDFTPQEYAMIEALGKCCNLVITLAYDSSVTDSIFRAGQQSRAWFVKNGLLESSPQRVPRGESSIFTHIASCWKNQNPISFSEGGQAVTLIHTTTKREEIAILAGEIKRLTRDENFRYQDITIIAAGIESYHAIVHAIFQEASIPYYLDEKKSLGKTSLARMIRSLLDLCLYNWSFKSLMSYVRCGLCNASQDEIDKLETFMLSRGIKWKTQLFDDARFGDKWDLAANEIFSDSENSEDSENIEHIQNSENAAEIKADENSKILSCLIGNDLETSKIDMRSKTSAMLELRNRLCENILEFESNCKKSATSNQYCRSLRIFLQAEDIQQKIQNISDTLIKEKQQDSAIALTKSWNELLSLLEQLEQIAKDTPLDLESFRGILANGMGKAISGTIPSAVDQVHFAPISQIRSRKSPVVFVIGMTDSAYPEKFPAEGILKDRDREAFSKYFEINIPSIISDKYYEDQFLTYSLFCLPSKRLYISCPEPKEQESKIIPFIRACVPDCQNISWNNTPGPFDLQIYSKTMAFHKLLGVIKETPETFTNTDTDAYNKAIINSDINHLDFDFTKNKQWEMLYRIMTQKQEFEQRLVELQRSNKNSKEKILLSKEKIAQRYGNPIAMSVSQLETYSACAYSHFAKYLLKLQPRATWTLQSSDTGTLIHGIVEIAVREFLDDYTSKQELHEQEAVLKKYQSLDFEKFSIEKMQTIISRDNLGAFNDQGFYASKGRPSYRLAASTLKAIFDQFSPQEYIPGILEWDFSQKNNNALTFQLPGFPPLLFNGKVDRIDFNGSYFRVIDYKSGNKHVEFDKWYHGLSLQLPGYIAAFCQQYPEQKPYDAAYMQFARPMISYENGNMQTILRKQNNEIKKQFKLRGTNLESDELIDASCYTINKMKKLSSDLLNGLFDINPRKLKGQDAACGYCEYMSICGFESKYDDFQYLEPLEKMQDEDGKALKKSAVFCRKIRQELGKIKKPVGKADSEHIFET